MKKIISLVVLLLAVVACDVQTAPHNGERIGVKSSSILVGGFGWKKGMTVQVRVCNFSTWKWDIINEFNCSAKVGYPEYKIDGGLRFECTGGYIHIDNDVYWQSGQSGSTAMVQMVEKENPDNYFNVSKQKDWKICYESHADEQDIPDTYNASSTVLQANCQNRDGSYARIYTNDYKPHPISIRYLYTGSSGADCVKFPIYIP